LQNGVEVGLSLTMFEERIQEDSKTNGRWHMSIAVTDGIGALSDHEADSYS
jgi:hypothetical protein